MRLGLAHHFGWAITVTADDDHTVIDRRRIELIEPGLPAAPIHHLGGPHEMHLDGPPIDDDALADLVARVRASVVRAASASLDRARPTCRHRSPRCRCAPHHAGCRPAHRRAAPTAAREPSRRAGSVSTFSPRSLMSRCGWEVHRFDATRVEQAAADSASVPTTCCTAPGSASGHRGRRTTGWRSPRPSSPADPQCRTTSTYAHIASSTRFRAASFVIRLARWVFTVLSPM